MDAYEHGLFDMPDREPTARPEQGLRGRSREVWARTVTVDITVVDVEALREAAARVDEGAVAIEFSTGRPVEATTTKDPDVADGGDAFDVLPWLVWPVEALEGPLESGAFRILSVDSDAVAESDDRGVLTWTVTVKLIDVRALRRLAAEAHPEEAGLIADSLAVAWERAADPLAPLHSIPGITWRSVQVEVRHLPRRANRDH